MRARVDLSGQRFDRLTAVRFDECRKSHTYWFFRCDCGAEISRPIQTVKKNKYNACPDCRKGVGSHAWMGVGEMPRDVFNTIGHGAAAKNLPFEVDMEYLWKLYQDQDGLCAFTGWPIYFNKTYRAKTSKTASLDRIDSSSGYVEGNLQWVHKDVNKLKKNMSDERFIELCVAVASKLTA